MVEYHRQRQQKGNRAEPSNTRTHGELLTWTRSIRTPSWTYITAVPPNIPFAGELTGNYG
jgi:hypothetical protein